jgi:hypothetical protein
MPSRDWDDNDWYDEGDFPPTSRTEGRSGRVTAGVFSLVMCGFNAIGAFCFLGCGFMFSLIGQANQGDGFLPRDWVAYVAYFFLGFGFSSLTCFILQLLCGIGLIRGRRWARTITLWLAVYSLLLAAVLGYLAAVGIIEGMDNEEAPFKIACTIIAALLHVAYSVVELVCLLSPRVARQFR